MKDEYRVTGDFSRMVYSTHATIEAARRYAKMLAKKWGVSHVGSEPSVERLTESGWIVVESF